MKMMRLNLQVKFNRGRRVPIVRHNQSVSIKIPSSSFSRVRGARRDPPLLLFRGDGGPRGSQNARERRKARSAPPRLPERDRPPSRTVATPGGARARGGVRPVARRRAPARMGRGTGSGGALWPRGAESVTTSPLPLRARAGRTNLHNESPPLDPAAGRGGQSTNEALWEDTSPMTPPPPLFNIMHLLNRCPGEDHLRLVTQRGFHWRQEHEVTCSRLWQLHLIWF